MEISKMMSMQVASLQQTVQLSLLQMQNNNSAATAIQLVQDMSSNLNVASHPTLGRTIDISV